MCNETPEWEKVIEQAKTTLGCNARKRKGIAGELLYMDCFTIYSDTNNEERDRQNEDLEADRKNEMDGEKIIKRTCLRIINRSQGNLG